MVDGSRFIERLRSEKDARPSLIRSLITVTEDLRSFVVDLEVLERRLS